MLNASCIQIGRPVVLAAITCFLLSLPGVTQAGEITMAISRVPYALGIFVAQEKGFFTQEGVTVRGIDCFPGKQCLKLLLDGKVDYATAAETPIVQASFDHTNFVLLASLASSSHDSKLVARHSAGIASPTDLVGKKVAVAKGTSADYFLYSFLLFNGIDPQAIHVVNKGASEIVDSLKNREVDAVAAFEPSAHQSVAALGNDFVVLKNPEIYTTTVALIARRTLVGTGDADMIKALRAIKRANDFIRTNPDEAKAILQQKFNAKTDFIDWIWPYFDFKLSLDQAFLKTMENEARWIATQNPALKNKSDRKKMNYLDYFYTKPLSVVSPAAVTLIK
jgi:ABC-type nitrate/sulfonate/bicarbonate transport system substrate-binding protein